MSRPNIFNKISTTGAPRACGDEPAATRETFPGWVLPAPAGMSPPRLGLPKWTSGAPRACGDEPCIEVKEALVATGCSPRLRG
ncbi:hypothetical protein GZ172_08550 [Dermatophilus congolensis]|nr:hypothetical protein [Dermatophilus congolensis]MBO3217944.1 hypothetical protein [Dermatophilus congolensis]